MRKLALAFLLLATPVFAADPTPTLVVPEGAQAGPNFDVEKATQAWVDTLSPEQRAKSNAYFEGGYVLDAVDFLYGLGVAALFLLTPLARRMRAAAEKVVRGPFLRSVIFAAQYVLFLTVFQFPMSWYRGFQREHAYGMANNSFGSWLGDEAKDLAIDLVLGSLFVGVLYLIFRKAPRTWWMWGTVMSLIFAAFTVMIAPVYFAPLFNTYKSVPEGPTREKILSLARANGIPANDVYWFDASKQTKRISANVSGPGNDARLAERQPRESLAGREHRSGLGARDGALHPEPCLHRALGVWRDHPRRVRVHGVRLRPDRREIGREARDLRDRRSGRTAAPRGDRVGVVPPDDAGDELTHAHARGRSRHLRDQRQPPAGRVRGGRDAAFGIPEDPPRLLGRDHLLRPPVGGTAPHGDGVKKEHGNSGYGTRGSCRSTPPWCRMTGPPSGGGAGERELRVDLLQEETRRGPASVEPGCPVN
jgi:hypothetical protein